jgi:hypothetical protein
MKAKLLAVIAGAASVAISAPPYGAAQQVSATPEAKPPASGLTAGDLENMRITTINRYVGVFRHARGEGPGRIEVHTEVLLSSNGAISWRVTRKVAADTPKGTKNFTLNRSNKGTIGVPGKVSDGSGDVIWVLDGDALLRMRTMASGGQLHRITLSRTEKGWSCTSDAPFAREVGTAGQLRDTAAMPGAGRVEMLSIKPTGSSCSAIKK